MRVLHVISDQNVGGAGILLCNLLRHFSSDVKSLVALPQNSALEERIHALGVPVFPLKHPCDRFSVRSVREIGRLIRENRVELIHANAALCARLAARAEGISVLHTRHCCYPPSGMERVPILRGIQKQINQTLSDQVIATADAAARDLERLGVKRERIHVIINGSDEVRKVNDDELQAFCECFGLKKEEIFIGICARLEACKGQDVFLRAAKEVLQRMPKQPIRFLIVGTGDEEANLRALAETLGIAHKVCFTGFVRDMAPVYRLLRVNVNCSRGTETSCLALSEGMSAGVPCVISDYGGNPAMIGSSRAGILYPTGDWHALADGICSILEDETKERAMREAARERFETHFTAKRMAKEVRDVYCELLLKAQQ